MPKTKEDEAALVQIGTLADRVGLSLRTVRYYEEIGLIEPAARSQGGFRLYGFEQEERLRVLKAMKPLGFSLEEMRDLVDLLDEVARTKAGSRKALTLTKRLANMQEEIDLRRRNLLKQIEATAQISSALDDALLRIQ